MRTSGIGFTLAFVLFAASVVNAAPPAAPQVTMGADLKLLRFDWEPVAGATFYRLRIRPGGSQFITLGENIPASITHAEHAIPVHLQDWARTRYIVTACNNAGCTSSSELNPRSLMLETIGYVKASNTGIGDAFGRNVVLSADGYTLAVNAPSEASNASGVNGNQANNSSPRSGAVYVFRRRGNTWQQEAYLKAGVNQREQLFGHNFPSGVSNRAQAISADGSLLAVAAPAEEIRHICNAGAVYVFRRTQGVWSLAAKLQSPQPVSYDYFGNSVDMSLDGRTLTVTSVQFVALAGNLETRTHIFVRPASTWQFSITLAPFYPGDTCTSTRLSGDGRTLVLNCATVATGVGRVVTMKRAGNAWVHASDLPSFFMVRQPIALNPDATVMALSEGGAPGVVGIYRWDSANWTRETGVTAPTLNDPAGSTGWGLDLALGNNGQLLGVGDPSARDGGRGVSPIVVPGTGTLGAVYLYQRNDEANDWTLRTVVKSPNAGFVDSFGWSISFSATGRTLAVGAPSENSSATGIDGNQENENAVDSGAAYLY